MTDISIGEAKKKLNADALAHAIMAKAEAAGKSITEWLADEEHALECLENNTEESVDCGCDSSADVQPLPNISPESKK